MLLTLEQLILYADAAVLCLSSFTPRVEVLGNCNTVSFHVAMALVRLSASVRGLVSCFF